MAQHAETTGAGSPTGLRPFHYKASDMELADMKRRIKATRWPEKETVDDDTQGVQLATMQALAKYWGDSYDWRKVEARLDALPPYAVGSVSGSMIFNCSTIEPGQPWVTITGMALSCFERTWMK